MNTVYRATLASGSEILESDSMKFLFHFARSRAHDYLDDYANSVIILFERVDFSDELSVNRWGDFERVCIGKTFLGIMVMRQDGSYSFADQHKIHHIYKEV